MGLKRIALRDFVIVSELELDLANGFTVLTGETGAGKSILIDAVQLVTGARADAGVVREGASRAEVSAEFESNPMVANWLLVCGFEAGDSLLLRRTVDTSGKSRAWVNGSLATATQLREIGACLLDIHGQHAWQSLTKPDSVRHLLDAYAQLDTTALTAAWHTWRATIDHLEKARAAQESLQREHERLSWQIGELDKLTPLAGEWESLSQTHTKLSNAQALRDAAQSALESLEGDDHGVIQALSQATAGLGHLAPIESAFKDFSEVLQSALAQVEDVTHGLRAYLRRSDLDPVGLAELDARMAQWMSMARRYKRQPADLPELLSTWKRELAELDASTNIEALSLQQDVAQHAYQREAGRVSAVRAKAAPALGRTVSQAMQGLGMQGGRFEVALSTPEAPALHGLEDVTFLVAGHVGSSPRPVAKVASGGELSRIALAIAVTTSRLGTAQTLIFDEVDAGVGGTVAETVGRLMRQLGADRQVLAVTHLPQVAACADQHLVVSKQLVGRATVSSVKAVTGEQRVAEISRMLGGDKLSRTSQAHAKEMLAPTVAQEAKWKSS